MLLRRDAGRVDAVRVVILTLGRYDEPIREHVRHVYFCRTVCAFWRRLLPDTGRAGSKRNSRLSNVVVGFVGGGTDVTIGGVSGRRQGVDIVGTNPGAARHEIPLTCHACEEPVAADVPPLQHAMQVTPGGGLRRRTPGSVRFLVRTFDAARRRGEMYAR